MIRNINVIEKTKAQGFPSPNRAVNTTSNEGTPIAVSIGEPKTAEKTPPMKINKRTLFLVTHFTS